jgi:ferredoxin
MNPATLRIQCWKIQQAITDASINWTGASWRHSCLGGKCVVCRRATKDATQAAEEGEHAWRLLDSATALHPDLALTNVEAARDHILAACREEKRWWRDGADWCDALRACDTLITMLKRKREEAHGREEDRR